MAVAAGPGRALERCGDLRAKGGQVVGQPGSDQVAISHHRDVEVLGARADHVVLDDRHAGEPSSPGDAGRGQDPARVTDGGDDRAVLPGLADQVEQRLGAPHGFGSEAAGDDQRVHIGGVHVRDADIGPDRVAELAGVESAAGRRRHHDVGTGFAEAEHRVPQLQLLVLALGEDEDAPAAQVLLGRDPVKRQARHQICEVVGARGLDDLGRGADEIGHGSRRREPPSGLAAGHDQQIGPSLGRGTQIEIRDDRIAKRADVGLVR